jgi:putative autoinducer-2 (AI-2) aldolase
MACSIRSGEPPVPSGESDRFAPTVPPRSEPYTLKGSAGLDWGMQNRLARVFRPATNRTVMLAVDHGYFQGPTTGLERVDLSIVPLLGYADALMTTRGMVRSTIPAASGTPIVLRASGGASILRELSDEQIAVSMEDAARINAAAVAVQVFIGGEFETQSVHNMTRLVDESQRYGIPVLAVTAVGKELTRDARYLRLATRICAELGAHVVKTYYCAEDFDTVAAACPVPLVMAGGKKLPELEALTMAYRAIEEGAAGVDMGRNIFQSEDPVAMIRAVGAVVHESLPPRIAYDKFWAAGSRRQPAGRTRA